MQFQNNLLLRAYSSLLLGSLIHESNESNHLYHVYRGNGLGNLRHKTCLIPQNPTCCQGRNESGRPSPIWDSEQLKESSIYAAFEFFQHKPANAKITLSVSGVNSGPKKSNKTNRPQWPPVWFKYARKNFYRASDTFEFVSHELPHFSHYSYLGFENSNNEDKRHFQVANSSFGCALEATKIYYSDGLNVIDKRSRHGAYRYSLAMVRFRFEGVELKQVTETPSFKEVSYIPYREHALVIYFGLNVLHVRRVGNPPIEILTFTKNNGKFSKVFDVQKVDSSIDLDLTKEEFDYFVILPWEIYIEVRDKEFRGIETTNFLMERLEEIKSGRDPVYTKCNPIFISEISIPVGGFNNH